MAIGAAIADPSVPSVAIAGDGGIGTFIGEARIAVERRLPMLTVLMSDGAFASIRTRALKDELTQQPLTIAQPSWLPVMEGIGMPVWRADSADSLAGALGQWTGQNGPGYIEVVFDRDSYEQMVAGVR